MNASTGTTLSDGTRLEDLFDLTRRRISSRIFGDPEIHRWEMERLFGHSWLFVGLESEIPEAGDYVVRPMGSDSVIVVRAKDHSINILLNRCMHRGVQLCVTDCGNERRFRCPYHGWTFAHDGSLEALPSQQDWLGPDGSKDDYTMVRARVEVRGGLIFGTWDQELPDLETYFGDFAFYFDSIFCGVDKNLVAIGAPQRWRVPFDWKLGAENSVGDAYHVQSAHASLGDIGMIAGASDKLLGVVGAERRWGHGFLAPVMPHRPSIEAALHWLPQHVFPEMEHHLSPEQLTILRNGTPANVATIFPNFTWSISHIFFFVRIWQPIAPGEIELWTWTLAHPDATDEQRRTRDRGLNLTFGVTGMIAQDDLAIFSRSQRAAAGLMGSQAPVTYACTGGAPSPKGYLTDDGVWPGPGDVWVGFPTDDNLWNYYMRWLHLMSGGTP